MVSTRTPSRLGTVWWWGITLATLVILDDLTFGPAFWIIGRVAGAGLAVAAVYAVYVPVQLFLVWRGTQEVPGTVAAWFLARLDLQRRYRQVGHNELRLRRRVVGELSALALSLLIAGVLPPLLLYRQGYARAEVRRLAVFTSTLYATEFALLHGYLPTLL